MEEREYTVSPGVAKAAGPGPVQGLVGRKGEAEEGGCDRAEERGMAVVAGGGLP